MRTNNLKKTASFPMLVIALLFLFPLQAQVGIISISVIKEFEDNHRTTLRLKLPLDTSKRFYSLDIDNSEITKMQDDTGYDMLSAGQGVIKESVYGYVSSDETYYDLHLEIDGAPQKGATSFEMEGTFLVNYGGEEAEERTWELPFKDHIQTPIETEIGSITIIDVGWVTLDDGTEYHEYNLVSQIPIEDVQVLNGDDSKEYTDLGIDLSANNLVYKKEPEMILIKVKTNSMQAEKVPLDLMVSIGF